MKHALIVAAIASLTQASSRTTPPPAIYQLAEMTWTEIDALDRDHTLVILPVGMLEEHGPHLPVGGDTIGITFEAEAVSQRVRKALPQWSVVMMPAVHYGQAGANEIGNMPVHPGTYSIRQSTLRSLIADIGSQLAQNRFKWIFVMTGHAAATHNIALNQACDFVSQTFNVKMLQLTALLRGDAGMQAAADQIAARHFSAADRASFGMDIHAGVSETSQMLAVRPELVRGDYKNLPARSGGTFGELQQVAAAPGWQGYMSAPALATAEYGRALKEWWIDGFTQLVIRAVQGEDMSAHGRVPDVALPGPQAPVLEKVLEREAAFEEALAKWLAQTRKR
jgi:creatinine amidohydrolase